MRGRVAARRDGFRQQMLRRDVRENEQFDDEQREQIKRKPPPLVLFLREEREDESRRDKGDSAENFASRNPRQGGWQQVNRNRQRR